MRWASLALCVVVVLAGCSGPTGVPSSGSSSPSEVTPAPVPTDEPSEPPAAFTRNSTPSLPDQDASGAGFEVAPGLSNAGVVDPARLARAHAEGVRNVTHRTVLSRTVRGETNSALVAVSEIDRPEARATIHADGEVTKRYANSTRVYVATGEDEHRQVDRFLRTSTTATPGDVPAVTNRLLVLYDAFSPHVVETVDGTYRLESHRLRTPERFSRTEYVVEPTNESFAALVDSEGVVSEFHLSYRATDPQTGERIDVGESVVYENLDQTTVVRPEWADDTRSPELP